LLARRSASTRKRNEFENETSRYDIIAFCVQLTDVASTLGAPLITERDRRDFFTPSTPVFWDHCRSVAERYGLEKSMIRHESVGNIIYDYISGISDTEKVFKVQSQDQDHYAKIVVLAIGPANPPTIPGKSPTETLDGACHVMHIQQFPDPYVAAKIRSKKVTNILVIGGGLTSAQIADLAIQQGVHKVWLLVRGPLKGMKNLEENRFKQC
jgi:cation diffusion facilitator CzcD-associated flavoprotein CzcO